MRKVVYIIFLFLVMLSPQGRALSTSSMLVLSYEGRDVHLFVPRVLPQGSRALVVVLHGGLGNASRIASGRSESGMNLDEMADKYGFIVAYLNGTKVARLLGSDKKGWNAGNCCGLPAREKVDDVAYITGAVHSLTERYGIDPQRVYGIGHSNGGMMTQRMICETNIYAAAIPISGPLGLEVNSCPAARGKRILAIHGVEDKNVPMGGGKGSKGFSGAEFKSEAYSRQVMENSGAEYTLLAVEGADHYLNHIDEALQKTRHRSIAEEAVQFFRLGNK